MKKENDEITDLFRTRLADAGMTVRDGFWEELSQDIPVACQHRRRLIFFRVAAAASVLLVLAASSATFWYLSPKEEMEEAFTKIVVANSGRMDGDGVRANQLPTAMEPVLPKPAPKSFGLLSQYPEEGDSVSISFSMSFSFSEEWMEMVYALISCRRQWNLYCRNRHLNHSDYYRSILRRETRFPFPSPCHSLSRQLPPREMATDTATKVTTVIGRRIMVTQNHPPYKKKNTLPMHLLRWKI